MRSPHKRRVHKVLLVALGALALVMVTPAGTAAAGPDGPKHARAHGLKEVRVATAAYRDLDEAIEAGYARFTDVAGIACIDNPGVGAMGIHYVKGSLVADPAIHAATPEALVYEPVSDGHLRLVAVEYIVLQSAWEATGHRHRPALFGRQFELVSSPNRYGLPPFFELHAWIWKHNPAGMFNDWNPRVSCHHDGAHGGGDHE